MQEHTNLYRIFSKDQQEKPMPMARVVQVLALILQKYEQIYRSGG